jgi:conjugal transfer pilus assembly protein TrbC
MIRKLPRPTLAGMAGFLALAAVSAALAQTVGDLDLGAIKDARDRASEGRASLRRRSGGQGRGAPGRGRRTEG